MKFAIKSGRYIDTFFMKATKSDLGVLECNAHTDEDTDEKFETNLIDRKTLLEVIPKLGTLVEKNAVKTAKALHAHGGGKGDIARISAALESDEWPKSGDPAEEAAAFAHQLLKSARSAQEDRMGVCWEFRGRLTL